MSGAIELNTKDEAVNGRRKGRGGKYIRKSDGKNPQVTLEGGGGGGGGGGVWGGGGGVGVASLDKCGVTERGRIGLRVKKKLWGGGNGSRESKGGEL